MIYPLKNRAISTVIDTTFPPAQQQRQAQVVLDPLTQVDLAALRAEVRAGYDAGTPRFLCPACTGPLFVAQNPASPGVPDDGRGAHFKHHVVKDAPPCALRSEANLRSIGAVKFAGLGEGADHAALKQQLAMALSQDPDITDIRIEQQIRASDGTWCQPDVSAMIKGRLVAFDLQLAGASLPSIQNRTEFYRANKVCHVWLTAAGNLDRLGQLAFRDLHLVMGGRIFAIDPEVVAACVENAAFQLKELSLAPRLAPPLPLHNVWDVNLVDKTIITMDPDKRKNEGEERYWRALLAQVTALFGPDRAIIRQAASQRKNLGWVAPQWFAIVSQIRGPSTSAAMDDNVSEVLAWLHAVEAYTRAHDEAKCAIALQSLQVATERLLTVQNAQDWAPFVEMTCRRWAWLPTLLSPDNQARLHVLLATTVQVKPLIRRYAGMIAVLYPWLSFRLIVKAPKFGPSRLRGPGAS
jgi:hypothetical protein